VERCGNLTAINVWLGALPNGFGYQFDMSDVSNMDAARHVTLRLYKAATVNHTVEVEVHVAVGKQ
jgi:hypothetical protein